VAERAGITSENFTFADVLTLQDDIRELRDQVKGAELDAGFHRADKEQAEARVAELEAERDLWKFRAEALLAAVRQEGT
jgi:hypothetical protein